MQASPSDEILSCQCLSVSSGSSSILQDLDFLIRKGEVHALVGESGSGKSTFANTVLGLLPEPLRASWDRFRIFGEEIRSGDFRAWKNWRGRRISLIPQSAAIGLHPFLSIGSQMQEYFSLIQPSLASKREGLRLLKEFGLIDPEAAWESRPHQLSGGERQRVLVLLSVYSGAELILADEPSSALDPETGKAILELLQSRIRESKAGLLFISHDLSSARELADTITVLQSGKRVETLNKTNNGWEPGSEYARKLFALDENLA
ncbi:ATP-binding cassette domain-containing protein [Leptospira langatensis]|uniref:ATP-binding cassette domain-containing protein n=1 Tax=Leptospira langatensis TaxID=2484983 RepID=UPI001FE2C806|nr:ATP-binding cassette domain-containing protein [Leptospira langatensis]